MKPILSPDHQAVMDRFWQRRSNEQRAERNVKIGEMYRSGMTGREIAKDVDMSAPTVVAIARTQGIPIRSPGPRGAKYPERDASMIRDRRAGMGIHELADTYGLSIRQTYQVLRNQRRRERSHSVQHTNVEVHDDDGEIG